MKSLFTATELEQVKKIIITAGENILEKNEHKILAAKDLGGIASNIVTQTDIDTENFLCDRLGKQFPQIGFYSEETYATSQAELKKELVWVVDPIDGTLNFSRGLPIYGISVGLLEQGKPIFGGIYFPRFNEFYFGMKGTGAYANKKQLHCGVRTSLNQNYGVASLGRLTEVQQNQMRSFFNKNHAAVGNFYSAVFHLSRTASGQFDFSIHIHTGLWDIAAGWAIIEAAGGSVWVYEDEKMHKQSPYYISCVAGNQALVNQLVPEVKKVVFDVMR